MRIDLNVKQSLKNKAMIRRETGESKWMIFHIASAISLVLIVIGAIMLSRKYESKSFLIFSLSALTFLVVRLALNKIASHLILDRYNETMWYEDGKLYYRLQTKVRSKDKILTPKRCYQFEYNMDSFDKIQYDEKSNRIQFVAKGRLLVYNDRSLEHIVKETEPGEMQAVFYDYTDPSLIKFFRDSDKVVENCTIKYKLRDGLIYYI